MKAIVNAKVVYPDRIVENGCVLFENGKILASGNIIPPAKADLIDAHGMFVGPGLVDIHCHGYAEVGSDLAYAADTHPAEAARAHLKFGTTSITPSAAYSWSKERFQDMVQNCRADMATGESSIIGLHYEGPFINPKHGAHSERAWKFSKEACDAIFDAGGKDILHCTYAPEMDFAPEFEKYLAQRGVVADIGHTELSPADCQRAVKSGAKIVTHLFDAMGCWRGDDTIDITGVIQETASDICLATEGLYYELICDTRGVHVKPYNMRLALRCAGEDRIIVVTDCADVCTHNPADYPEESPMSAPDLNYDPVTIELSGSRLTLSQAVRNFMGFTNCGIRVAFKCGATNAARALGVDDRVGAIATGLDANLLIVDEGFHVQSVFFHGRRVEA